MSQKFPNKTNGHKTNGQKTSGQMVNSTSHASTSLASVDFETFESGAFNTRAYHELLENPHIELDGLQRLEENLARLEDLHGRLQFLMRDITSLLKK